MKEKKLIKGIIEDIEKRKIKMKIMILGIILIIKPIQNIEKKVKLL